MLLRWALVYLLTVTALLLCGAVAWQQKLVTAAVERHRVVLEKFEALSVEATAARAEAQSATALAATVKTAMERDKREAETQRAQSAHAGEALTDALVASRASAIAKDVAEQRLADELKRRAADKLAIAAARDDAEKARAESKSALAKAETAEAEVKRLHGLMTGSIERRKSDQSATLEAQPPVKPVTSDTADVPPAAPPPPPAAAPKPTEAEKSKGRALAPTAAAPDTTKKVSKKTPSRTSSAKPRKSSKPSSGDLFF